MPIPLILDTDIGDDIDDALALALILNSPELELRGVTTVFRDALRRTLLAQQLLALMRREVPVATGASQPLLQPWSAIPGGAQTGRQMEALEGAPAIQSTLHAVEFLADHIQRTPQNETLTLACIGPLTNIALLGALHPALLKRCRLLIMGGKWSEAYTEWNILCDPEAAAMVFSSGADITMVGLDVTLQCVLSNAQVAKFRAANKPHATFLADLIALWAHEVTLHDPLTLLTLCDDCVRFEPKRIQIGLHGDTRAQTLVDEGEPNCRVAVSVDVERAIEGFMKRVLA